MGQRKEKTMRKIVPFMLVLMMMAVPFTFTATALACDGDVSFGDDLDGGVQVMAISDTSTLAAMKSYLQTQYNSTKNLNLKIGENLGLLFALNGIQYAIDKVSYGQVDCSRLVHESVSAAYVEKSLGSYYPFGGRKSSEEQYNDCVRFGLAKSLSASGLSSLRTGDLVFWYDPDSGSVNHVGIFFKYNSKNYVIESRRSANGASSI